MRNAPNPLLFPHASVTRRNFPQTPSLLPYLVLLRVGFSLPAELLLPRCALTAPFHPYPTLRRGGIFSVALSVEPLRTRPAVSRHAALWRPDFPLPRPRGTRERLPVRQPHSIILAFFLRHSVLETPVVRH